MENNKAKKDYVTYCKDFAIDSLNEMKGCENNQDAADLGNTITESINIDGSATYSTYEAKEYIKEWWNEAAQVYEYQKDNYGECSQNPFESPEAYHVIMIIEGVNNIMNQCDTIQKNWNENIELTDEILDTLIKEVEAVNEISF